MTYMRMRGRVRLPPGMAIDDAQIVKESRVHFEILCEQNPDAFWVAFRIQADATWVSDVFSEPQGEEL